MANVNPVIHSRAGTYILEAEYPGWTSPEDAVAHVWHQIETGQIMFVWPTDSGNRDGYLPSPQRRRDARSTPEWVRFRPEFVLCVHCVPFD